MTPVRDDPTARRAGANDVHAVVSILVDAFYLDPAWSWAFPDASQRAQQLRWLWELSVRGAMRYPWVWLSAHDTAASVWVPPHGTDLSPDQEATIEPALTDMLGAGAGRVLETLALFDRSHPRSEAHFYLSLLGTRSEHRGHGYGLALLADNLRRIDELSMPAYLEASNPANVPLYERYGFAVRGSFTLPADGPDIVTMWREPSLNNASVRQG